MSRSPLWPALVAATLIAGCAEGRASPVQQTDADWPVTGGDPGNARWSPLRQIDRSNVARLQVAWTFRAGDPASEGIPTEMQATPIVVDGVLYATTPGLDVVALRADSGTLLWRFDPFAGRRRERHVNRGVVYWEDRAACAAPAGECDRRILFVADRWLHAIDARTGRLVRTFGDSGRVNIARGLGRAPPAEEGRPPWDMYVGATSPGVIFEDLLVQGTRVSEGDGAAPGHVRAFDVRTGAVRWIFHTIPQRGEPGVETWPAGATRTAGGANSWPGMSVDTARGLVFVPTGSASPDFYGGLRAGRNLYANTLLALDARTGRRVWHFQVVHHDLWDRDLPAAPSFARLTRNGRTVDALAQITKFGFVFVFDRATGAPLFPIVERPVPRSDVPGERSWPTQPFPTRPAPFARQRLTEDSLTSRTPEARSAVLERYRTLRGGRALYAPPSMPGTIVLPGFDGGGEWGGAAVDRETGVLYVNASDVPWIARMVPAPPPAPAMDAPRSGAAVYAAACASCHGAERRGDGAGVPSLVNVGRRLSHAEIEAVIANGRGFMPAVPLHEAERDAVVAHVRGRAAPAAPPSAGRRAQRARTEGAPRAPYRIAGYERWRDPDGFPAIRPPWGTLSAIDLNTGEYRWRIPLGRHPALPDTGEATGTELYGGPIVTAGGLVFVASTMDARIRAFDKDTGRLLWKAPLPAAGFATPSTYMVGGRQYLVIAAGGGKLGLPSGDAYVAFALP